MKLLSPLKFLCSKITYATVTICVGTVTSGMLWSSETEDPWFQNRLEHLDQNENETTDSTNQEQPGLSYSSEEIFRVLMKQFEALPRTSLSKRLSILERISINTPAFSSQILPLKTEIESKLQQLRNEVDSVLSSNLDLQHACTKLDKWSDTICADEDLKNRILESTWLRAQKSRIAWQISKGNFQETNRLLRNQSTSSLCAILNSELQDWIQQCLVQQMDTILIAEDSERVREPLETYFAGQLIGSTKPKIKLQLILPKTWDSKQKQLIQQELNGNWGPVFEFIEQDQNETPDLVLICGSEPTSIEWDQSEKSVESFVLGKTTEHTNPEFVALTATYKRAAERYQMNMKHYQFQKGRFDDEAFDENLSTFDSYYDSESSLASTGGEVPEGESGGDLGVDPMTGFGQDASASAFDAITSGEGNGLFIMENERNEVRIESSTIKLEKPEPEHLEVLDRLAQMESVIVESEPATPYSYKTIQLDYEFKNQGVMKLQINSSDTFTFETPINLVHHRNWTRNEGAKAADPTVIRATFSEDAVKSAKQMFELEFAKICAASLEDLINQATQKLSTPGGIQNETDKRWNTALKVLRNQKQLSPLSKEQLLDLLILSNNPTLFWSEMNNFIRQQL